jgi:endonuclease/exonuclease/phosphatase family metal-dependent hydrolase
LVPKGLDTPVSFVSVHNDWIDEEVRVEQVRVLLKAFESTSHPVILAGDFNGERTDRSMLILQEKGWKIIDKQGQKTFPSGDPRAEIDFVVIKDFIGVVSESRVIPEIKASDHRPVLTILRFN